MNILSELMAEFNTRYGRAPRVFSAPGRVNLIGEHTDYNDGFVLPMAIDRRTYIAAAARDDHRVRCASTSFPEAVEFIIDPHLAPADDWANHVRGLAAELSREHYHLTGADLLIASEVPLGAGLSSSAALEVAVGYALLSVAGEMIDLEELAEAAQRAEQEYTGTRCGIMDQYISCFGVAGHALLIDCRSLEYRAAPLAFGDARVVVCDTMVRHNLATSEYNARRAECEIGVKVLTSQRSEITALRDVSMDELEAARDLLPEKVYRRCRHVIGENERTTMAAAALDRGEVEKFGELMNASHASLRDDYEVSCPELDLLVEIARECEGVYGARMTGGGFGGSTVNLVAAGRIEEFSERIIERYHTESQLTAKIHICHAEDGVREESS
jgi:galactokinase